MLSQHPTTAVSNQTGCLLIHHTQQRDFHTSVGRRRRPIHFFCEVSVWANDEPPSWCCQGGNKNIWRKTGKRLHSFAVDGFLGFSCLRFWWGKNGGSIQLPMSWRSSISFYRILFRDDELYHTLADHHSVVGIGLRIHQVLKCTQFPKGNSIWKWRLIVVLPSVDRHTTSMTYCFCLTTTTTASTVLTAGNLLKAPWEEPRHFRRPRFHGPEVWIWRHPLLLVGRFQPGDTNVPSRRWRPPWWAVFRWKRRR
jgi:hypothetical protein